MNLASKHQVCNHQSAARPAYGHLSGSYVR